MAKFYGEIQMSNKDLTVPFYVERIELLFFKEGLNENKEIYFSLNIMGSKIVHMGIYKYSEINLINNVFKKFLNQNKQLSMQENVFRKITELVEQDSVAGVIR